MDMNIELIKSAIPLLIAGAGITVEITALSVFFGMLIGIIVALARLSGFKILRWLGNVYVDFIRGTPLLIQIFLVYFALPSIIGSRVDAFFAAISACSINSGAYVAEVFRGGIQSIDVGQMEAGRSLGLSKMQCMRQIILPQAVRNVLPALGNEFIVLMKDTSIVGYIALIDLAKGGDIIRSQTYSVYLPYLTVAAVYLILVMTFTGLLGRLERHLRNTGADPVHNDS